MAKWTLELFKIERKQGVFTFPYEFYTEDETSRLSFEKKFLNKFSKREIGSQTVGEFKRLLKSTLDLQAPYYKQLFETELESKGITFLLNKDLTETFVRELDSNTQNSQSSVSKTLDENNTQTNASSLNTASDTPQNFVEDIDNYMSSASKEKAESSVIDTNKSNGENNSDGTVNTKDTEKTTLISKGNIGTTSSAELLQKWREALINIDELLLEEFEDLFMEIF